MNFNEEAEIRISPRDVRENEKSGHQYVFVQALYKNQPCNICVSDLQKNSIDLDVLDDHNAFLHAREATSEKMTCTIYGLSGKNRTELSFDDIRTANNELLMMQDKTAMDNIHMKLPASHIKSKDVYVPLNINGEKRFADIPNSNYNIKSIKFDEQKQYADVTFSNINQVHSFKLIKTDRSFEWGTGTIKQLAVINGNYEETKGHDLNLRVNPSSVRQYDDSYRLSLRAHDIDDQFKTKKNEYYCNPDRQTVSIYFSPDKIKHNGNKYDISIKVSDDAYRFLTKYTNIDSFNVSKPISSPENENIKTIISDNKKEEVNKQAILDKRPVRFDRIDIARYIGSDNLGGQAMHKQAVILDKYASEYNKLIDFANEHELDVSLFVHDSSKDSELSIKEKITTLKADRDKMYLFCHDWAESHNINAASIAIENDTIAYAKMRYSLNIPGEANLTPFQITDQFNRERGLAITDTPLSMNGKSFIPHLSNYAISEHEAEQLTRGENIILAEVSDESNKKLHNYRVSLRPNTNPDDGTSHYIHIDGGFPTGLDTMKIFRNEEINEKYRLQKDSFDRSFGYMAGLVVEKSQQYDKDLSRAQSDKVSEWLDSVSSFVAKTTTKAEKESRQSRDEPATGEAKYDRYYFLPQWQSHKTYEDGSVQVFMNYRSENKLTATKLELEPMKATNPNFDNLYQQKRWEAEMTYSNSRIRQLNKDIETAKTQEITNKDQVIKAIERGRDAYQRARDAMYITQNNKHQPSPEWIEAIRNNPTKSWIESYQTKETDSSEMSKV